MQYVGRNTVHFFYVISMSRSRKAKSLYWLFVPSLPIILQIHQRNYESPCSDTGPSRNSESIKWMSLAFYRKREQTIIDGSGIDMFWFQTARNSYQSFQGGMIVCNADQSGKIMMPHSPISSIYIVSLTSMWRAVSIWFLSTRDELERVAHFCNEIISGSICDY